MASIQDTAKGFIKALLEDGRENSAALAYADWLKEHELYHQEMLVRETVRYRTIGEDSAYEFMWKPIYSAISTITNGMKYFIEDKYNINKCEVSHTGFLPLIEISAHQLADAKPSLGRDYQGALFDIKAGIFVQSERETQGNIKKFLHYPAIADILRLGVDCGKAHRPNDCDHLLQGLAGSSLNLLQLDLPDSVVSQWAMGAFLKSKPASELVELEVGCANGSAMCTLADQAPASLRHLDLTTQRSVDEDFRQLVSSKALSHLTTLKIRAYNEHSTEHGEYLSDALTAAQAMILLGVSNQGVANPRYAFNELQRIEMRCHFPCQPAFHNAYGSNYREREQEVQTQVAALRQNIVDALALNPNHLPHARVIDIEGDFYNGTVFQLNLTRDEQGQRHIYDARTHAELFPSEAVQQKLSQSSGAGAGKPGGRRGRKG